MRFKQVNLKSMYNCSMMMYIYEIMYGFGKLAQ